MIGCTLLLALLPATGQAPAPASVVKVYNLSSAVPGGYPGTDERILLPILLRGGGLESREWDPGYGADAIVDLLRNLAPEEFEYEGRRIQTDDGGRLLVEAPPAVQALVERYIGFLEGVFGASTEIVLDAVDWPAGADAIDVPVLVPMADAEKLLSRAGSESRRTWRLRAQAGRIARLDCTRAVNLVTDYEVEVAQSSTVADPVVEDLSVGTRMQAGVAPAPGGTWLTLILQRGDPLSEPREHDLEVQNKVTTQERVSYIDTTTKVQAPEVLNRSFALNTFLPEGKALAIRSSGIASGKPHGELLIIRRGAGALPTYAQGSFSLKDSTRRGDVLFLNAESAVPPHCEISARELTGEESTPAWTMWRREEMSPGIVATLEPGTFGTLHEVLNAYDDQLTIRELGAGILVSREDAADGGTDDSPDAKMYEGCMERISGLTPAPRLAQVVVALRRGEAEIARCALPLRDGVPATAVLGSEALEVGDLDVEIAQSAAIADPVMRVAFDGIAVWLRPSFTLAGDLALEVLARAQARNGARRQLDLGTPGLGQIEQSTYDQLLVREKLLFRKAEGSPKAFVLGEAGGPGSKRGLTLQVEAREVR